MAKYLEGTDLQKNRAYSPAVITEGGRIVWLAGQATTTDRDGQDISGNFEAQTHRVFALIDDIMRRAGGTLANLVTMTVFIKEPRYGDRFVELRKQKFPDGKYPGSALITVTNFARPGMEIEIQAIAVIGDRA
jgi:2-iminobutanoate/2-iminopropanoate deaminase